jgi:hypothetical protein
MNVDEERVMKLRLSWILFAPLVFLSAVVPVMAHHSFAAEFDRNKTVDLKGVVTRIDWINPHAFVFLDVKDDNGKVTPWEVELSSPNGLIRRGWNRNSLKVGETISLTGYRAKNGANVVSAGRVTLTDGRQVFAGSSADGSPVTPTTERQTAAPLKASIPVSEATDFGEATPRS